MNRIWLSQGLIDEIIDVNKRTEAGLPVTDGERAWIKYELDTTPGYLEWLAQDMLDKAIKKKALA
jgi:hypothetical protein